MYGGVEDLRPAGSKENHGGRIADINTCQNIERTAAGKTVFLE